MRTILADYIYLARKDHLKLDIRNSLLIGLIIIFIAVISNVGVKKVLEELYASMSAIITAFSILAGFNITSLSIFATSNSPIAVTLREELINGTDRKKMDQILAYFAWSIVMQLILLFFSIIASFVLGYITGMVNLFKSDIWVPILWFLSTIAITGIVYSVNLTLRNISILYQYLIAEGPK